MSGDEVAAQIAMLWQSMREMSEEVQVLWRCMEKVSERIKRLADSL